VVSAILFSCLPKKAMLMLRFVFFLSVYIFNFFIWARRFQETGNIFRGCCPFWGFPRKILSEGQHFSRSYGPLNARNKATFLAVFGNIFRGRWQHFSRYSATFFVVAGNISRGSWKHLSRSSATVPVEGQQHTWLCCLCNVS
jgi:hypothetical protein